MTSGSLAAGASAGRTRPLPWVLGHFDPEPAANLAVAKARCWIGRVAFFERGPHGRIQPLRGTMTRVAQRPVDDGPQHSNRLAEIDGIALDVASKPAGVGLDQRRGPCVRRIRRIAEPIARSACRHARLTSDPLSKTNEVDMTGFQCG